jgi:voltage-gated potassium channel Kch
MAKGTIALIGGLTLLSLAVILIAALILVGIGIAPAESEPLDFIEAAWSSLMHALDSGAVGGDIGWSFRIVMFGVTLGGIFILSTLIGVLTSGIEGKLDELRKGRSRVIEQNHTVILGWSPQIFSIISELVIANLNQRRSCIVILGDKDKVEMEEEIRTEVGSTGRTRIVCRTGSPINMADLELVSLQTSRAIIVLSSEAENSDADVIKSLLAITNNPNRRAEPYHIVAEMRNPRNLEVARMVGRNEVELILTGNLISRIIAQTCRQSGLSIVYSELLDFSGDEIYFKAEAALVGKTFAEALLAYERAAVIGLYRPGRQVQLNPLMETRLQAEDQVIVVAEDDDQIHLSGLSDPKIDEQAIQTRAPTEPTSEHTLILGWNWRAPIIINELDHYTPPGSSVMIVANYAAGEAELAHHCAQIKNQRLTFQQRDTTDRHILDQVMREHYDHIIVLSYSDNLDKQEADSLTLITLLHLRDIAERTGNAPAVVSEMLDPHNRELAEVTRADDFIVSDRLISLMLAQVSEHKQLNTVFADIFDPEGSEIYLKPAADYVALGVSLNFYTVVEAARRHREVALGYRLKANANEADKFYGVVVNPNKSEMVAFADQDRIIVLAES